jgi:site-specific DNA-methyltransferase (adenine-specific)
MKIIKRNISELSQDPANARKHNERNLESIVASLRRFGQQTPIVIDSSSVVRKGNGTLEAAKRLGWDTINCVVTDLKSSDAISYAIADNRTAELAEWDDEVLAAQLNGLLADDPELMEVAGFTEEELAALLADSEIQPEVVEDEVPEPPVDPITKPGDLWLLGEHRLLCGDSTKAEDVERLMAGAKADLWLTDPPYGVAYESAGRRGKENQHDEIENDSRPLDEMAKFWEQAATLAYSSCSGSSSYYWFACQGGDQMMMMMMSISRAKWRVRHELIWVKDQMVFGRCDYHYKHEPILYGWKQDGTHEWNADRKQVSVLEFDRPKRSDEHPTMKPVGLVAYLLGNNTTSGDSVLDTFCGSGTTLIAAEQLGRKCYGMEISSQYVDVICNRWAKLTNESPVLEETGETFDQVAKRRRGNE